VTHNWRMAERFTDEELEFLRHVRFGQLPERVRPEDYVELTESDPPAEEVTHEVPQAH
jgi:hypothetical protein